MAVITAGDVLETIIHIIKLCYTGSVVILSQLILICFQIVRWTALSLFYFVSTLLKWLSTTVSLTLRLIGVGAKNASQMNDSSGINAGVILVIISVVVWLVLTRDRRRASPTYRHPSPPKITAKAFPKPERAKTYTTTYTSPPLLTPPATPFNEPLRPYKTWDGAEPSRIHVPAFEPTVPATPPTPPPSRPPLRPKLKSESYTFRSFDPDEYISYLKSLTDELLRNESESVTANLVVHRTTIGAHWAHAAATGGLTSPISVIGTAFSGRKSYVNDRKLELIDMELASRGVEGKFGAKGIAKVVRRGALTAATLGMLPQS